MFDESLRELGALTLNTAIGREPGPPLLMLHGFSRQWRSFLPLVPALQSHWQLHAIDFRGHGRSEPAAEGYRVIDYVEDALQAVDQIDDQVVLYGHSLGSMVAAAVAAQRTDQVHAIVLEDPPLETMGRRISLTPLHGFFRDLKGFAGDTRNVQEIALDLAEIELLDPQSGTRTRLGDVRDSAALRFTAGCLKCVDPHAFAPILLERWLEGYEIDAMFENIRCPILLIQADFAAGGMLIDEDVLHLKSLCRELTHIKLDGVGHLVHWTHTQQLANLMLAFLADVS